ncbi:hypothetical protein [Methylobacterium sp. GC_Met_3]|nr:hypothetical protein [Methylobacterium sp. GC_Met_3]
MHDDPKPSMAVHRTASSARTLRRVADALGVPVSSFGDVAADLGPTHDPSGPEEAAVLATVRSYLKRVSPAARDRFVAAVQTMVKLPSA